MTSELASKTSKIFIQISYGDNPDNNINLVNVSTRQVIPFGVFEPDPKLAVEIAKYTGDLKESASKVSFDGLNAANPEVVAFAKRVTDGRVFHETTVVGWELESGHVPGFPDQLVTKLRFIINGKMQAATFNPAGTEGLCELDVSSKKSDLGYQLGIQSNEDCTYTLGEPKTCTVNIDAYTESSIIDDITGLAITAQGLSLPWAGYWDRGYIEKDGLSVLIRFQEEGTDIFQLSELPPSEWLGEAVTFVPGCKKTRANCQLWQNLFRFMGAGIAVPDHNPIYESADK